MALNVLIVDDSAVMRTMVLKVLKMSGVPLGEVYEAADGKQGLDTLDRNWVDLVIVDINMPVMTGVEMIERIRANPTFADLPIVVVSTEGSENRIGRLAEQGVAFVHKPFTPEILKDAVTKLVEVPDAR
jgi:two-component system chemotaxis response regulator CheY